MKNHKKKLIAVALLMAMGLYIGFRKKEIGPEDLEISKVEPKAYKELSQKDVREEVELLVYALEHGYAGKLVYPELYTQMLNSLKEISQGSTQPITIIDFRKKIEDILLRFPDGHLYVGSLDESIVNTEIRKLAGVDSSNSEKSGNTKEDSVEESLVRTFSKNIKGKKVFFVNLPTFEIVDWRQSEKLTKAIFNNLDSDAMIIDLRMNTGGRLPIPMQIASLLWGEVHRDGAYIQYFPMPLKTTGVMTTPVTTALSKNFEVVADSDYGRRWKEEYSKGFLEKVLTYNEYEYGGTRKKALYSDYDIVENIEREENTLTYEDSHFKEKGFKKPIFLIVDKYCASACEKLLEALESHPFVKVVGEQTSGTTQFGNVGILTLPKSHLRITIAASFIIYKDNRVIERIGYKPHIAVNESEDPVDKAIRLIK